MNSDFENFSESLNVITEINRMLSTSSKNRVNFTNGTYADEEIANKMSGIKKVLTNLESYFELSNDTQALKKIQTLSSDLSVKNCYHNGVIVLCEVKAAFSKLDESDFNGKANYSFTEKKETFIEHANGIKSTVEEQFTDEYLEIRARACLNVIRRRIGKKREITQKDYTALKPVLKQLKAALSLSKKTLEIALRKNDPTNSTGTYSADRIPDKFSGFESFANGIRTLDDSITTKGWFTRAGTRITGFGREKPKNNEAIVKQRAIVRKKYVEHKWDNTLPNAPEKFLGFKIKSHVESFKIEFNRLDKLLNKSHTISAASKYLDRQTSWKKTKLAGVVLAGLIPWLAETSIKSFPATGVMALKLVRNIVKGLVFSVRNVRPINGLVLTHLRHMVGETLWNVKENPYSLAAMGTGMMTGAASKGGAFLFLNPVTQAMFWTGVGLASAGTLGSMIRTGNKMRKADNWGKRREIFKHDCIEFTHAVVKAGWKAATMGTVRTLGATGGHAWGSDGPPASGTSEGLKGPLLPEPPPPGSTGEDVIDKIDKAIDNGGTQTFSGDEVNQLMKVDTSGLDDSSREFIEGLKRKLENSGYYQEGHYYVDQMTVNVNDDEIHVNVQHEGTDLELDYSPSGHSVETPELTTDEYVKKEVNDYNDYNDPIKIRNSDEHEALKEHGLPITDETPIDKANLLRKLNDIRIESDSEITVYQNMIKVVHANGDEVTYMLNGDEVVTSNGVETVTSPDGTVTVTDADGTVTVTDADGTVTVTDANGNVTITYPPTIEDELLEKITAGGTITLIGAEVEELMEMDPEAMDPRTRAIVAQLKKDLITRGLYVNIKGVITNNINEVSFNFNGDTADIKVTHSENGYVFPLSYELDYTGITDFEELVASGNNGSITISQEDFNQLVLKDPTTLTADEKAILENLKGSLGDNPDYYTLTEEEINRFAEGTETRAFLDAQSAAGIPPGSFILASGQRANSIFITIKDGEVYVGTAA